MRPRPFKLLAASLVVASAGTATPFGDITDVVVAANRIGPPSQDCDSFALTPAQARAYFERAIVVSGAQAHDFFLHGPCAARGTFRNRYDLWQWEISDSGTATVTATNGETFRLADPAEQSPLGEP